MCEQEITQLRLHIQQLEDKLDSIQTEHTLTLVTLRGTEASLQEAVLETHKWHDKLEHTRQAHKAALASERHKHRELVDMVQREARVAEQVASGKSRACEEQTSALRQTLQRLERHLGSQGGEG